MVGVQIITGIFAVGLSAWLAYNRSLDLVANSLRLRLDSAVAEIEQRTWLEPSPLLELTPGLYIDLPRRFEDPIYLLNAEGELVTQITTAETEFPFPLMNNLQPQPPPDSMVVWEGLGALLQRREIIVQIDEDSEHGTWGLAPLFHFDGSIAGGLLVKPLTQSINQELSPTREAFVRALFIIIGVSGLLALILGAFFTWWLIRPLRRMTDKVAAIGAGNYSTRMEITSEDEFGRLAAAINQMADEVEASIDSLKATDKLRRELITNVGHDLRTPLAAVLGYNEQAERYLQKEDMPAAKEALDVAQQQGNYLKQLVNDLFELSRFISGPPALRQEPVPVGELLHEVVQSHRTDIESKGIQFHFNSSDKLPIIPGDGLRLMRVLNNLLSNAKRYTPTGEHIWLKANADDDTVTIQVRDSGEGMSKEEQENIFERYYRGSDARTRQDNHTGLGLAISRAIIQAHGGTIQVESSLGKGTTFTVHLPTRNNGQEKSELNPP